MTADRNRTTVRRALKAGGIVGAAAAVTSLVAALAGAIPGAMVIAAAIAAASLVAAGWLLLAAFLDMLAGELPDLRRTAWTAAATFVAMLGPFLVLGTFTQGGRTP